jgi:hypothetical protein
MERQYRALGFHRVQLTKMLFVGWSVDSPADMNEFVPGVENVFEVGFKQISL